MLWLKACTCTSVMRTCGLADTRRNAMREAKVGASRLSQSAGLTAVQCEAVHAQKSRAKALQYPRQCTATRQVSLSSAECPVFGQTLGQLWDEFGADRGPTSSRRGPKSTHTGPTSAAPLPLSAQAWAEVGPNIGCACRQNSDRFRPMLADADDRFVQRSSSTLSRCRCKLGRSLPSSETRPVPKPQLRHGREAVAGERPAHSPLQSVLAPPPALTGATYSCEEVRSGVCPEFWPEAVPPRSEFDASWRFRTDLGIRAALVGLGEAGSGPPNRSHRSDSCRKRPLASKSERACRSTCCPVAQIMDEGFAMLSGQVL